MKDLYRHLRVTESAGDAEIRAALPAADADTRDAVTMILLDPARRAVYDRNRRTVATIGRLRANLGMNLTRFWPRSRFRHAAAETRIRSTMPSSTSRRPRTSTRWPTTQR